MDTIRIANKLRIYEGNILLLPGCEPISTVSNISNFQYNPDVTTLYHNFEDICVSSYVTLDKAKEIIPEARIIWSTDMSWRWFVLPDGPSPNGNECPKICIEDWYKILRENADGVVDENGIQYSSGDCAAFGFDWYCR